LTLIGEADRLDAGRLQRQGMRTGRPVETAFEVAEDDVGGTKLFCDEREGHRRIGDVHQIHVTGEDHFHAHLPFCSHFAAPDDERIPTSSHTGEGRCLWAGHHDSDSSE